MTIIGIDPGLSGAIAILQEHDEPQVLDTPTFKTGKGSRRVYDEEGMRQILAAYWPGAYAIVEKQQPMTGQGVSSTFATGYALAIWIGLLRGIGIPHEIVRPQAWQKALGIPPKSGKAGAAELVSRLWPNAPIRGSRGGLKDGRTDALCLALWGQRQNSASGARETGATAFSERTGTRGAGRG